MNNESHYTECGLNNIYLVNGFEITKNADGDEEIFIRNIHGLHKIIGMILVTKYGLLRGDEIKFIRNTLDLSQARLAKLLGVDYQSVLGWEKNKRFISKTADHFLKTIFFSYIDKNNNNKVFDTINEIAEHDAKAVETDKEKIDKIIFDKKLECWRKAA